MDCVCHKYDCGYYRQYRNRRCKLGFQQVAKEEKQNYADNNVVYDVEKMPNGWRFAKNLVLDCINGDCHGTVPEHYASAIVVARSKNFRDSLNSLLYKLGIFAHIVVIDVVAV